MKEIGRKLSIILLIGALLISLTGCSSKSYGGVTEASSSRNGYYWEESSTSYYETTTEAVDDEYWIEGEKQAQEGSQSGSAYDYAKLIYTANITLETTHFDDVIQQIRSMTDQYGGYLEYSDMQNYSTYRYSEFTVRIPSENYQTFVTETNGIEQVMNFSESVQNISQAYYDTELRLESAKTKLASLNELLAKAESMEDIITLQNAINDVQYEIDSLSGTLRNFDQLVGFSTIHLYIREVPELTEVDEPVIGFGEQVSQAFRRGANRAVSFCKGFVIWLAESWVGLLIWIIIILAIVLIVKGAIKKNRQKEEARRQAVMAYQRQQQGFQVPNAPAAPMMGNAPAAPNMENPESK